MKRIAQSLLMVALTSLAVPGAGHAQQPPAATGKPAPAPKLDAEALRIPDGIHDTGAKTIAKPNKPLPPPSLPNKVDLGQYDLEFRAKHSGDVNPRTGLDSGETSNLSNSSVGRKSDPALPNYFGLKLSAPTD
ncbi:MAG: hypothetical protein Q8M24_10270 [Pseudolabrys sp.]|nr:hypothetical protein [Pseudolabrys sp.]MDP2295832.1 hypothetical protein [Pseudolabrys sp.]